MKAKFKTKHSFILLYVLISLAAAFSLMKVIQTGTTTLRPDIQADAFMDWSVSTLSAQQAHELSNELMSEEISEELWNTISSRQILREIEKSDNLFWKASYQNKTSGSDRLPCDEDAWYGKISVKNGTITMSGNLFDSWQLDIEHPIGIYDSINESLIEGGQDPLNYSEFSKLQFPDGYEFEISYPAVLIPENTWIYANLYNRNFIVFSAAAIALAAILLLILLVWLWPYDAIRSIPLFQWISQSDVCVYVMANAGTGLLLLLGSSMLLKIRSSTDYLVVWPIAKEPLMSLLLICMAAADCGWWLCAMFFIRSLFQDGWKQVLQTRFIPYKGAMRILQWVSPASLMYKSGWYKTTSAALCILAACLLIHNYLFCLLMVCLLLILLYMFLGRMEKSWQPVYEESLRLAQGAFDSPVQSDTGFLQPVYENLLKIRSSYQQSLKQELESRETKNELIGNVSHDLKTPLTGLKNYTELLERAESLEDARAYAARAADYTRRLSLLVDDLFDISRASSGALELEYMDVNLPELLQHCLDEFQPDYQKHNLEVVFHHPPDLPAAYIDPYRTERIFDNLACNLAKYAMPGTRIFADLQQDGDMIKVTIKNVSAVRLDLDASQIIRRFVRGDRSRHEAGSGLGLAIVKSFTQAQNGSFEIEIDGDLFKTILFFPITSGQ